MEAPRFIKQIISPRYRELERLRAERRMRNMLRGLDLTKPRTVVENARSAERKYMGVSIVSQDGTNIEIVGDSTWVSSRWYVWDQDLRIQHEQTGISIFTGRKKIPFNKVIRVY